MRDRDTKDGHHPKVLRHIEGRGIRVNRDISARNNDGFQSVNGVSTRGRKSEASPNRKSSQEKDNKETTELRRRIAY